MTDTARLNGNIKHTMRFIILTVWPRQRFPSHWLGTYSFPFLYLSEDSDQEHIHIKYLDTVKMISKIV